MSSSEDLGSLIRFGAYEVDLESGELRKHGLKIKLRDQSFQALALLLERPGRVVTREDLQRKLWAAGTFVDFDHGLNKAINRLREALGDSTDAPVFVETLPKRGYRFIAPVEDGRLGSSVPPHTLKAVSAKAAAQQPSIAVLPFANMSSSEDDKYFSDGLAEEILNRLAHIPELKVTARTSSFAYRGERLNIRKIGDTLGVRTILEGSVRRDGNRIRVMVQLINAADGCQLWSDRYDRDLTDVFAIQDEIGAAIAAVLQVKLVGKPVIAPHHQPNLPAYDAFLKARHQLPPESGVTLEEASARAEDYCRQAIELDPQWADPHAALGRQYFFLGRLGLRPLSEMVPLARAEARKALELLPSEPNAHAVLGAIAASHDYDWKEAGEQFRQARASEPLSPSVYDLYAMSYLAPLGRFDEAIEQQAKAIAQDPLNMFWRTRKCMLLLYAEMYEPAIIGARKVLEVDDRDFLCHSVIALSNFFQGKLADAREPAEEAFHRAPWNAGTVGFLAGLLSLTGEDERARKLLAAMRGITPAGMILYHLVRSEIDAAIDWYERGIEQRQPFAAQPAYAGFYKPLRSSPRWPKLARMMNLPETD